jgi:TRAP-type C4-dicarboxylate transport system permease small subunit
MVAPRVGVDRAARACSSSSWPSWWRTSSGRSSPVRAGAPSSYTEELARYLLIWVSLLGGAYAAGQRMHLAIDVVTSRLAGVRRAAWSTPSTPACCVFALAAMVVGGTRLVYISFALEQMSAALRSASGTCTSSCRSAAC